MVEQAKMSVLLVLPIVLPLLAAALAIIAYNHRTLQRIVAVGALIAVVADSAFLLVALELALNVE